jgi:hypothetical protein
MSIRLKRFMVGIIAALPATFLFPAEASAAVCVNANVAPTGATTQANACNTNVNLTP